MWYRILGVAVVLLVLVGLYVLFEESGTKVQQPQQTSSTNDAAFKNLKID